MGNHAMDTGPGRSWSWLWSWSWCCGAVVLFLSSSSSSSFFFLLSSSPLFLTAQARKTWGRGLVGFWAGGEEEEEDEVLGEMNYGLDLVGPWQELVGTPRVGLRHALPACWPAWVPLSPW